MAGLIVICSALPGVADSVPSYLGLTLPQALEKIEQQGLVVIFSTALVGDDMVVRNEPSSSNLRVALEEILADHGLALMEGPTGQLVVIGADPGGNKRPDPEPANESRSRQSVFLTEIVVTPSHFRILDQEPESRFSLSREQVEQMPHAADDLYRAVKRLPGTASADVSAKFSVRGGEQDELLVLLDGVELYEPFHLKDFQSVFSIVDAETVGGVDFLTGGFPVEFGDRMSGVMNISSSTPVGPPKTSVAVGTINSRVVSEGSFNEGRGQWLVNGRAWYPATVAGLATATDEEILTDYYDVFAKLQHSLGRHSTISANVLLAYDDLGFSEHDDESVEEVSARYRSHQEWINLRTNWTKDLFSQTVLSSGLVDRRRIGGFVDHEKGSLDIDDRRIVEFFNFKQDWTLNINDRHYLKWGVEARRESAEYDYSSLSVGPFPEGDEPPQSTDVNVDLEPAGTSYAAYIADRFRLAQPLVIELGLRWDRQFYVGEHQLSPRFNLMYEVGPHTAIRAAWGRFYQSQRINELQVEDGVTDYYRAQLAVHSMVSLEQGLGKDLSMRFEIYNKDLSDLRPRYENMFVPIELFPEAAFDRVRIAPESGRSRGLEVIVRRDAGRGIDWWLSYGIAYAEDIIDGETVPRLWDQRHAASFGINWSLARDWNLNLAGTYHSGWPTTDVSAESVVDENGEEDFQLVLGPLNGDRLPSYLRFDLRASRSFSTTYGAFRVYLEILNLTHRKNVCCRDDFVIVENPDGSAGVDFKQGFWAPIIPSLAVSFTF